MGFEPTTSLILLTGFFMPKNRLLTSKLQIGATILVNGRSARHLKILNFADRSIGE